MAITVQAQQADGTWAVRNAFTTENAQVRSGALKVSDLEAKARRVMAQWQQTAPDARTMRVHNSDSDPKPVVTRARQPLARMRHCFWCFAEIGVIASEDYDDFDTCGKPECEHEGRIERREQRLEEQDWAAT